MHISDEGMSAAAEKRAFLEKLSIDAASLFCYKYSMGIIHFNKVR